MNFNNANGYSQNIISAKQRQAIKSAGLDFYLLNAEKVGNICDVEITENDISVNVLFMVRNDNGDGGFFAAQVGPRGAVYSSNYRLPA